MGIGLDRVLMLRKGIDDIRLLRSNDPRVVDQLCDLAPYRPISDRPAIARDISIAVDADITPEVLGDRARSLLGARADLVETIEVVSDTPLASLPRAAAERLGMGSGQRNVLLRVVLRALDRTLTDTEANAVRDDLLTGLHQGDVSQVERDGPIAPGR
jgi:phenylalanyl-tRNA synthetase alpha chain